MQKILMLKTFKQYQKDTEYTVSDVIATNLILNGYAVTKEKTCGCNCGNCIG